MSELMRALTVAFCAAVLLPCSAAGVELVEESSGATKVEGPHLSASERSRIEQAIAENVRGLLERGVIAEPTGGSVTLDFPLRPADGVSDYGVTVASWFVDHDPARPGALLDYECGERSIDALVNHRGTDYSSYPFPWLKMANSQVWIISAAAGTIVFKDDGHFDQNCGCSPLPWNAVYVRHADGSIAWYGHMKSGSTTPKNVGQTVAAGEYLGVVGSSGCSGSPHLHFELYDAQNFLQDPYAGPCNSLNANSWWASQEPYHVPRINKLMTGTTTIGDVGCGVIETPHGANAFGAGDRVFVSAFYRDLLANEVTTFRVLRPDDSEYTTWTYSVESPPHTSQAGATWVVETDPDDPAGTWRVTADYAGQPYEIFFTLGGSPAGRLPADDGSGVPLTLERTLTGVTLHWGESCIQGVPRKSIHIGQIGNYYNHYAVNCGATGTSEGVFWSQMIGNVYFIAVPVSGNREGSYGFDSDGNERPRSTTPCYVNQDIGCP